MIILSSDMVSIATKFFYKAFYLRQKTKTFEKKIKEKYENSDNPADYKFKAYNSVMQNLINYGKNEEVS